jgi:heme/copper-type cytochrome/quinol oxidase subunit 2
MEKVNMNNILRKISWGMLAFGCFFMLTYALINLNYMDLTITFEIKALSLLFVLIFFLFISILSLVDQRNHSRQGKYNYNVAFYTLTIFTCSIYLLMFIFSFFAQYSLFEKIVDLPFWTIGALGFWLLVIGLAGTKK